MWSLQKFSDPRRRTLEKHPRLHPRSDSLSQTSQQIRGKCLNSGWCQWIWSWRLPVVCCSTKNLLNFIQMLFDVDVWKWSTAVTVPKVWQLSGRTESCHEYIIYQETGNWTSRRHPQQTASNISPAQFTWMTEEESRGFTAPHSISADSLPRQSEEKTPHRHFVGKVDGFGGNSDAAAQLSAHYARVVQVPDCGLCAHRFGFVPDVDEKLPSTGSGVLSGSEHAIVQNHIWIIC